jgi:VanZ family protein
VRAAASRFLPIILYAALITYLSSKTGSDLPHYEWMKYDKVLHALEYSGLGFLFCRALGAFRYRIPVAAAMGLAFGVLDEFHQTFVPGRQGNDLGDMTADLVGATLGAIAYVVLEHLIGKVRRKETA